MTWIKISRLNPKFMKLPNPPPRADTLYQYCVQNFVQHYSIIIVCRISYNITVSLLCTEFPTAIQYRFVYRISYSNTVSLLCTEFPTAIQYRYCVKIFVKQYNIIIAYITSYSKTLSSIIGCEPIIIV